MGDFAAWMLKAQQLGLSEGIDGWRDDDPAMLSDWGFKVADARHAAVWHGSADNLVPPQQGMWIAGHIPGARRHQVEGEGHLSIAVKHFEQILDDLMA